MATFTWTPSYVLTENPGYRTLVSKAESGKEQRRSKWSTPKRTFSLKFNVLTQTDTDEIRDFYIARKGAFESFFWTNPRDNVQYTVRFLDDKLPLEIFAPNNLTRLSIKFIEVI